MNCPDSRTAPEDLHPALWRASQLAQASTRCIDTGHPVLSAQLPGGGWPTGSLIDLLPQQPGIGELRLLRPALAKVASRRIVLLQPPHPPQALALAAMGLAPSQLVWIRSSRSSDALWAAEQVFTCKFLESGLQVQVIINGQIEKTKGTSCLRYAEKYSSHRLR